MRVIAGYLGGRSFKSPPGHKTHPMSDKVRGALFNVLGDIKDLTVLDAFAGSGALGIEAISRGARRAMAVEVDKTAHKTIQENIRNLGIEACVKAIRANISSWSDNNPEAKFDLILCDPPYNKLQLGLVQKISRHAKPEGLVVVSSPGDQTPPKIDGLDLITHKNYGDASVLYYRKVL